MEKASKLSRICTKKECKSHVEIDPPVEQSSIDQTSTTYRAVFASSLSSVRENMTQV